MYICVCVCVSGFAPPVVVRSVVARGRSHPSLVISNLDNLDVYRTGYKSPLSSPKSWYYDIVLLFVMRSVSFPFEGSLLYSEAQRERSNGWVMRVTISKGIYGTFMRLYREEPRESVSVEDNQGSNSVAS